MLSGFKHPLHKKGENVSDYSARIASAQIDFSLFENKYLIGAYWVLSHFVLLNEQIRKRPFKKAFVSQPDNEVHSGRGPQPSLDHWQLLERPSIENARRFADEEVPNEVHHGIDFTFSHGANQNLM